LAAAGTVDIGFAVEQPDQGAGRFTHSALRLSRGFDVNRDRSLSRVAYLLRVPSSQLPLKAFVSLSSCDRASALFDCPGTSPSAQPPPYSGGHCLLAVEAKSRCRLVGGLGLTSPGLEALLRAEMRSSGNVS